MRAYISSDSAITPKALDIIRHCKGLALGDSVELDLRPVPERVLPAGATVLAFGKYRPQGAERVVPAPSIPQVLTKADIITRLCNVFTLLAQPPELPPFRYSICDPGDTEVLLSRRDEVFAVDLEWSGDDDRPAYERVLAISIHDGRTSYVIPEDVVPLVYKEMCAFLEGNGIVTVNGKGDLSYFPDAKVTNHFDAQLAHYVLFPAAGEHGLKPVTKKYFGFDDWDEPGKRYTPKASYDTYERYEDGSWHDAREYSSGSGFERIPREMLYEYAGFDTYATWHWYLRMKEMLAADPDAMRAFQKRMRLSDLFMQVEGHMFRVDVPHLEALGEKLENEREVLTEQLNRIAGQPINSNSPKQVKDWFHAHGVPELPKQKVTSGPKKGQMQESTNEKSMQEILGGTHPEEVKAFASKLLELRGNAKELGTYVNGYLKAADENGFIRPTFNLAGPVSGRLANRGAGVMTIPKDDHLRKMVIPSGPGRVLVKPDYGQLELRIVAAESKDLRLIAAFQPGMPDFFVSMMPTVFPDIDFSGMSPKEMKNSPLRQKIKPFSHGLNYGRGAKAIAEEHGMPVEEAVRIAENYLGPEGTGLRAWQDDLRYRATHGQEIVTPYGFHLQSELVTSKNRVSVENTALSFPGQSIGNDMCLEAALRIAPRIAEYDAWIFATVHDQILADCPIEHAKTVGEIMQFEMEQEGRNIYGDLLVFEAEPEYGFDWSQKMGPKEWDDWLAENGY
jgi:DNA polymerase I-like protein with 3'-5' exonuclease and polymerase domains